MSLDYLARRANRRSALLFPTLFSAILVTVVQQMLLVATDALLRLSLPRQCLNFPAGTHLNFTCFHLSSSPASFFVFQSFIDDPFPFCFSRSRSLSLSFSLASSFTSFPIDLFISLSPSGLSFCFHVTRVAFCHNSFTP